MQSKSDVQLLREYATHGTEAAFAEIVARHTNLVYSAALRQVESADIAAELAQGVFLSLVHSAQTLSDTFPLQGSLAGWLCRTARNISLNRRRDDFRRQSRERQAMANMPDNPDPGVEWEQIRPVLDEAMSELSEPDYDALVMRFFNNQDLRSVGEALGVSDDAAQKRVARALDKLRESLSRRGIKTAAATLSLVLSAKAIQAGPSGLAAAISTAAAAVTAAVVPTTTAVTAKITLMTATHKAIAVTACVALAGIMIYQAHQSGNLRKEVQNLHRQQAPLNDQIQQLAREREDALRQVTALRDETERLNQNAQELLRLRGEVARLRNAAGATQSVTAGMPSDRFGVPPGPAPPLVSSSTREMAWAYAQLRRKSLSGAALDPAEEVHLAKAWPYVRKLEEPDQFAHFQANYIASVLDLKDQDTLWRIKQILEAARETEHAKGLRGFRLASNRDFPAPPATTAQLIERLGDRWRELDQKTRGDINALLSPDAQALFSTAFPSVLDFDPVLKADPVQAAQDPKFTSLAHDQIMEAWPKRPGEVSAVIHRVLK